MVYVLHTAVDVMAERFPEKDAVRYSGKGMTFSELAQRANGLAHVLKSCGLLRGERVGIFMNKSLNSAVAIYGILKAGGIYVPMDPFAPASRVALLIRDCGIRHLITTDIKLKQSFLLDEDIGELEWLIGAENREGYHCTTWEQVLEQARKNPPSQGSCEMDPAYILYTSGSTGTPKGIVHTHHSAMSFARWAADTYKLIPDDRISNHAPLHFDLSTFDFFAAGHAGATTVIIPEAISKLPVDLGRLIARERISVWYSVPFALIQLLERGKLDDLDLSSIRWILFAGEVFPTKHLRKLMDLMQHADFSNLYGPTETNVCTYYNVPSVLPDSDHPIPIGKPCENVEALVVDEDDNPIKNDEAGELLIHGDVIMKGYWGRADLNEKAFYRLGGYSDHPEKLFYRTGDLVEWLSDGNLKYLGRKDRQIKTRGYRVELDEIESALNSYPLVEEAAVYPIPDGQGSCLIEAVVSPKVDNTVLSLDEIYKHIGRILPPYAVPVKIRFLKMFPRTSTGKIDRKTLQAQMSTDKESNTEESLLKES